MFGSLRKVFRKSWLNNKENHYIKLSTPKYDSTWQVFSIYKIDNTNDYIQTEFSSNREFKRLIDKLIKRSEYNFNLKVNEKDKILTLSTCHLKDDRLVLHAKLIKKEKRK